MIDPWNPTAEELKAWAYTSGVAYPDDAEEDWDAAVIHSPHMALALEFAGDAGCPNQGFFLSCLYLYVGDAVKSKWRAFPRDTVTRLVDEGAGASDAQVRAWARAAAELIENPNSLQYEAWCEGKVMAVNGEKTT